MDGAKKTTFLIAVTHEDCIEKKEEIELELMDHSNFSKSYKTPLILLEALDKNNLAFLK